jgi:hypothetical protein
MHFTIGLNGVSSLCVLGIPHSQRRTEARDVNLFASCVGGRDYGPRHVS